MLSVSRQVSQSNISYQFKFKPIITILIIQKYFSWGLEILTYNVAYLPIFYTGGEQEYIQKKFDLFHTIIYLHIKPIHTGLKEVGGIDNNNNKILCII